MQTSNFLRTFSEAFRQGCRNCIQSVQWSVISKNTLFEKIPTVCMFSDSQLRKWGPLAKKLRKSFKWEIYVFRWLFEKDNACCWENTFLYFELFEKKVWEIDEIISAVFSKENSTFPDKSFARKLFFREYYVFFSLFFDLELSVLRLLAGTLL